METLRFWSALGVYYQYKATNRGSVESEVLKKILKRFLTFCEAFQELTKADFII